MSRQMTLPEAKHSILSFSGVRRSYALMTSSPLTSPVVGSQSCPARYAADAIPGSGAVPYIQVLDLEELRKRAVGLPEADVTDIIVEPGISLLKIIDPDGQLIEFYAL